MTANFLVIAISLLCSAFFSGMEIAFFAANKLRLELDKKQGNLNGRIVGFVTRNPSQYISTILVGNSIALVVYGIEFAKLLDPFIVRYITANTTLVLLLQTVVSTGIILVTAEFLPKSIFRRYPNALLTALAPLVLLFYVLLYPVSRLSTWLSYIILRYIARRPVASQRDIPIFGRVDLDSLVERAHPVEDEGGTHEQELRIFQNALDFSEVRLRDCMIPRTDIEAIEADETVQTLQRRFIETKYSRLPVFTDSIDNIVGYVNSKDLFLRPSTIGEKMMPIDYFPETMFANKALAHFIKEHRSIAVVVDEFGGTAGLITIEDIMEEIFGEIDDEHDKSDLLEHRINDREYLLSGRLEIVHLNETYGFGLPESDEYDTLAGFILHGYHNIPTTKEVIALEGFTVKIERMHGARIDLVRLTLP